MTLDYLAVHDALLAQGAAGFSDEFRKRQIECVTGFRCADGGYRGRMGGSDPYYTDFACRVLWLLGAQPEALAAAGRYVGGLGEPAKDVIDAFCRLNVLRLAGMLGADVASGFRESAVKPNEMDPSDAPAVEGCQGQTGTSSALILTGLAVGGVPGLAKISERDPSAAPAVEGRPGQTGTSSALILTGLAVGESPGAYETFLACLCNGILGDEAEVDVDRLPKVFPDAGAPGPDAKPMRQTSTTAAAAAVRLISGALSQSDADEICAFLAAMQAEDGGFLAHPAAPHGDLLSTYTAYVTLAMLGGEDAVDAGAVARFLKVAALPEGGFRSCALDTEADVEYTFYGVAVTALLLAKVAGSIGPL